MHFVGRVLGKAVMEGYTVPFNFTPPLFKAILGSPFTLADLEYVCLHKIKWFVSTGRHHVLLPPTIQTNIF